MSKPDNPPAFPVAEVRGPDGIGIQDGCNGMTLLDWFAGQAIGSVLTTARPINGQVDAKIIADGAYGIAEAMLREREKRS